MTWRDLPRTLTKSPPPGRGVRTTRRRVLPSAALPSGAGRSTAVPSSELSAVQPGDASPRSSANVHGTVPLNRPANGRPSSCRSAAIPATPVPVTCSLPLSRPIDTRAGPPTMSVAMPLADRSASVNASVPLTPVSGGTPARRNWASANVNSPATLSRPVAPSTRSSRSLSRPRPSPSAPSVTPPSQPATGLVST